MILVEHEVPAVSRMLGAIADPPLQGPQDQAEKGLALEAREQAPGAGPASLGLILIPS